MDLQIARQYVLNQALKLEAVPTPFWPDLDGSVYLQDVPSGEIGELQMALRGQSMKLVGALICKALVVKDKEKPDEPAQRLFLDTDRDAVLQIGTTILAPLGDKITTFFGMNDSTLETTVKNA